MMRHNSAVSRRASLLAASVSALAFACTTATPLYPPRAPLLRDPDRRPFRAELERRFTGGKADRWDKSFFQPVSRFFAVQPGGESVNVNSLDEVPDSSWYENRAHPLSIEAAARGACRWPRLEGSGPWRIVSAKPDGANPGFMIEAPDEQRYMVKFDGGVQSPRGATADVVGSRIYYAGGFDVPCNNVVAFDRSILRIAPDAEVERATGDKTPMVWADVEQVLAAAPRRGALYVGVASRFLEGRPLGPWAYHGTRDEDRNDIVPHDDRRELRGSRLLAAWTAHWDAREQNTLAMWIETSPGVGFVRHHLLDFGDCFGAWGGMPPQSIWRRGRVHWFDPGQIVGDFVTFGAIERPWDRAQLGPTGPVFGYYDVEQFDPEDWRPSHPNPAFGRMTERDGAWMARVIARIGPEHLNAMVGAAELDERLHSELLRILVGRREKILRRYLDRLSPLADPRVVTQGAKTWLCVGDLAVRAGVAPQPRTYSARAWAGAEWRALAAPAVVTNTPGEPCVLLPHSSSGSASSPTYSVIEISSRGPAQRPSPARFHLYHWGGARYLVAGIERAASFDDPPG